MNRYTVTYTNNETGETDVTECDGFFLSANVSKEECSETIQHMSTTMVAAAIASSKELRQAARIAIAMMDAVAYERQQSSPIASAIIQAIKDR